MTIFAKATVSSNRVLGTVDDMIYGQYLEHVQPEHHCIYGAIVDEPSALTDEHGFRLDVIDAVRDLGVPVVRWPGGCFADIYHWEDGVGPKELRPARRNWHWGGIEPNTFGTDEFLGWAERIGALPYLNFNLGTGTLDEAIRWLDYCNGSELTADVLNRQANGRVEPWNVRFWGVGNEQWGPWEANSLDAETYAERLRNWTQFFRKLDPAAEFMGIASHSARDPEWDLTVLLKSGHLIDWITLHAYGHSIHDGTGNDYYPTVTFPVFFEERLIRLIALIESASAKTKKAHTIKSHHNVGGLPDTLHLKLLEPLRELFKDEVRELGIALGLPHDMVYRHPFPGPGLGVRILGEVKGEYADLLRRADAIFIEELRASGWYEKTSQAFTVFLPVKSVGVMGDGRTYDYVVALRAVQTQDFMTAHWAELPYTLLGKVSNRIINEVCGINRVVYDISGKPPATIEWE